MFVSLIAHTHNPEETVCRAAHLCYSNNHVADIDTSDAPNMIHKLISAGHLSAIEHASFTFAIEGISRVCLAQLTRHRIASFSVRSQRYVKHDGDCVMPIDTLTDPVAFYKDAVSNGIHQEDARYALPMGSTTSLVLTMNARELLHFFQLRCCFKAQWEIRQLANSMLDSVKKVAPNIFKHAGSFCRQNGFCREPVPCGKVDVPHIHFLLELYRFWNEERKK